MGFVTPMDLFGSSFKKQSTIVDLSGDVEQIVELCLLCAGSRNHPTMQRALSVYLKEKYALTADGQDFLEAMTDYLCGKEHRGMTAFNDLSLFGDACSYFEVVPAKIIGAWNEQLIALKAPYIGER